MSRTQAASFVMGVFLIGSQYLTEAPGTADESRTIPQSGADPLPMIPQKVN
jgi:hypothetical protein